MVVRPLVKMSTMRMCFTLVGPHFATNSIKLGLAHHNAASGLGFD